MASETETWTSDTCASYIELLKRSPIRAPHFLTKVVSSLSSNIDTKKSALTLASYVSRIIKKDTEVESRIEFLGTLARSVWQASKAEAVEIYKQGLELADALGSDCQGRPENVLQWAV